MPFLAKANALMMRVDLIPLCINVFYSLMSVSDLNSFKLHHCWSYSGYFPVFFFIYLYFYSPVCVCVFRYSCLCTTFISPIRVRLAVRRKKYGLRRHKNITGFLKKEVKLILCETGIEIKCLPTILCHTC